MFGWGGDWSRPSVISDAIKGILQDFQEALTKAVRVINTDHAYIHQKIAYKSFIKLESFGEANEFVYVIKAPETKDLHFKNIKLQAKGGSVDAIVKRGTTANPLAFTETEGVPNVGTTTILELTGPNNLSDYGDASATIISKTPTFDTEQDGENWFFVSVLGDATNQFISVDTTGISDNEEVVMKADTYYLVILEKVSNTPENITLTMFWYEEPPMIIE